MDLGGAFDVEEIQVGRAKDEVSFARLKVHADSERKLESILLALQSFAPCSPRAMTSRTSPPAMASFLPTSTPPPSATQVRLNGRWVDVQNTEMDLAIVVSPAYSEARMIPRPPSARASSSLSATMASVFCRRSVRVSAKSSASW